MNRDLSDEPLYCAGCGKSNPSIGELAERAGSHPAQGLLHEAADLLEDLLDRKNDYPTDMRHSASWEETFCAVPLMVRRLRAGSDPDTRDRIRAALHEAQASKYESYDATLEAYTDAVLAALRAAGVSGSAGPEYPRMDGDFTVIGPECFADAEATVVCWRGENYYRGSAGRHEAELRRIAELTMEYEAEPTLRLGRWTVREIRKIAREALSPPHDNAPFTDAVVEAIEEVARLAAVREVADWVEERSGSALANWIRREFLLEENESL